MSNPVSAQSVPYNYDWDAFRTKHNLPNNNPLEMALTWTNEQKLLEAQFKYNQKHQLDPECTLEQHIQDIEKQRNQSNPSGRIESYMNEINQMHRVADIEDIILWVLGLLTVASIVCTIIFAYKIPIIFTPMAILSGSLLLASIIVGLLLAERVWSLDAFSKGYHGISSSYKKDRAMAYQFCTVKANPSYENKRWCYFKDVLLGE